MITIRPGSHIYNLIFVLSIAGEYPMGSLDLIGNERFLKKYIRTLGEAQEYLVEGDSTVYRSRLLQVSGKSHTRTLRLNKSALGILNSFHPNALKCYMKHYHNHIFPGNESHVVRNHRVGETIALCWRSGVEVRPYALPVLQKEKIDKTVLDVPSFYISKSIKKLDSGDLNKNKYTRIVGVLFYPGGVYAVYNTRNAVMKWAGLGEFKSTVNIREISRMNAGVDTDVPAILFGSSLEIALKTLIESDNSKSSTDFRFDKIYPHIHYVPLSQTGIRLLKILTTPDWKDKMLNAIFSPDMLCTRIESIEFDALSGETYIYSHLDSDISRLARLKATLPHSRVDMEVLCYPWQVPFIKSYLGSLVRLKQIKMEQIEEALGTAKK